MPKNKRTIVISMNSAMRTGNYGVSECNYNTIYRHLKVIISRLDVY